MEIVYTSTGDNPTCRVSSTGQVDTKQRLAQLEQWDTAKAAHSQRMAAQEAKVQRAQDKADAAAAAKHAHDLEVYCSLDLVDSQY